MTSVIILGFIAVFDLLNYFLIKADIVPTLIVGVACIVGIVLSLILPKKLAESKIRPFISLIILVVTLGICIAGVAFGGKSERLAKADDMDVIYGQIIKGEFDKATQNLDAYDGKYGIDDLSTYNRAVTLIYTGKYEDAITLLHRISNQYKDGNPEYYYAMGEAYEYSGNMREALINYETALKIDPNHYESLVRMGYYCLYNDDSYKHSLYYLRAAEYIHPDDPGMLFILAKAYFQAADYEDAKFYFDEACRYDQTGDIKEASKIYYEKIRIEGGIG